MTDLASDGALKTSDRDLLASLRADLDRVDVELLGALCTRVDLCRRIARYKRDHGVPMMQPDRVDLVHRRAAQHAEAGGLDLSFVRRLYDLIIHESCRVEDLIIDANCSGQASVHEVAPSDGSAPDAHHLDR